MSLLAGFGLAACGDSTAVNDELSVEEAAELGGAVMMATFTNTGTVPQSPPASAGGPQAVPFSFSFNWDFTADCDLGGVVAIDAAVEVDADTDLPDAGTVDYVMSQVHDGCVVEGDEGRLFTLDGAPGVTVMLLAENDGEGHVGWSGSLAGAVAWETDGRSGVCELELEFAGGANDTAGTGEFEIAGSVCGTAIDHSGSIG